MAPSLRQLRELANLSIRNTRETIRETERILAAVSDRPHRPIVPDYRERAEQRKLRQPPP
jgi:hypothetical protein